MQKEYNIPFTEKGKNTRNQIRTEAFRLFYFKGYRETTVREIAAGAGLVNSGALYYYYSSKDEILKDIISSYFRKIMRTADTLCQVEREPLVNSFVAQKLYFRSFFLTPNARKLFLDFIDASWLDEIIIRRNLDILQSYKTHYRLDISSQMVTLHVLAVRGAEVKLIRSAICSEIDQDVEQVFDYICRSFPSLVGISEDEINACARRAEQLLGTISVDTLIDFPTE